jgi:hypothetical protein
MEEMRNSYKTLVGKSEAKRRYGRPGSRLEDNIRMDLRETAWKYVDLIHLAQDKDQWQVVLNTIMNLRVPQKARNFLTS